VSGEKKRSPVRFEGKEGTISRRKKRGKEEISLLPEGIWMLIGGRRLSITGRRKGGQGATLSGQEKRSSTCKKLPPGKRKGGKGMFLTDQEEGESLLLPEQNGIPSVHLIVALWGGGGGGFLVGGGGLWGGGFLGGGGG